MEHQINIDMYKKIAKNFRTEEDVRIGTNSFLKVTCEQLGISLDDGHHEVTSLFGGRADSIYSNIIIEYKAPSININTKKGYGEIIDGRDSKDRGLRHYLVNFALEDACNDNEMFIANLTEKVGVGFNGKTFIFARYVQNANENNLFDLNKTKAFPKEINTVQSLELRVEIIDDIEIGMKKLMLFLRSTSRKKLSSKNILELFGPQSSACKKAISSIYNSLSENITKNNSRVITLFEEWNRIFGDVYGEIETDFTKINKAFFNLYQLETNDFSIRKALFTVQTYYNIILKLLVFDLLNSLSEPMRLKKTMYRQVDILHLFSGKLLSSHKINNFFEIQFFEWFLYASDFDISIIQESLLLLGDMEVTASVIKPEVVEDVFREVYNGLMPKEIRHLLGEYYTPGWLVEFVLNKAGYNGERGISLLDPTCGSGSFVTHAIKRFVDKNKTDMSTTEIVNEITCNIVGYDINPIAVITAKTNYILALGDITSIDDNISIPIYMCDSILVPTVHAKQNELSQSIIIETVAGKFEIPVFDSREKSDIFIKEMSSHIENYTFSEFIDYLRYNDIVSLDGVNMIVAESFFNKVCELHLTEKDGFWGIILKNAFAPLFAKDGFDIVVGNPPWIAWKAMSDTYRRQTLDIWLSYGIFEKNAYDKITTHDDFAMAVTYVSLDHYCKQNGQLVFVLPQTFLKASKGGEGFRKFCITCDGRNIPFAVSEVYDMLEIRPFRGVADNRASVVKFIKNKKMAYPMDNYFQCVPIGARAINYSDSYSAAISKFAMQRHSAKPINSDLRSPWLTMLKNDLPQYDKFLGASEYRGRKGIEPCGAKGIYLIDIISSQGDAVQIINLIERSRLEKAKQLGAYQGFVEKEFIYPMVGGRNIDKWGINSHLYMLVPHNNNGGSIYRGVSEGDMKVKYPKTFNWLYYFHDLLLETRIRSGKFFDEHSYPFYRLDNVGPYTFQPYRVVWREQHKKMTACVVSSIETPHLGEKIVVTDSKVLSCSFDKETEAHYLCAIINSPIITKLIESYTIDTQRGIDILSNIKIPKFDTSSELHNILSKLSLKAHKAYLKKDTINAIEQEIDEKIHMLFS